MDELAFRQSLADALLCALPRRLNQVADLRYGLSDGLPRTLADVAEPLNISRERVRQLLEKVHQRVHLEVSPRKIDGPGAAAALSRHIRQQTSPDSDGWSDRIVEFAEAHLPEQPLITHALPLLCHLLYSRAPLRDEALAAAIDAARRRERAESIAAIEDRANDRLDAWLAGLLEGLEPPQGAPEPDRLMRLVPQRQVDESEISGRFFSEKLDREVMFESGMERHFLRRVERMRSVRWYTEQPMGIPYRCSQTGATRNYYPDVLLVLEDGRTVAVEVKPVIHMPLANNLDKFAAARPHLSKAGIHFLVTSGHDALHAIAQRSLPLAYEAAVMEHLAPGARLNWPAYQAITDRFSPGRFDLVSLTIKHGLRLELGPFSLSRPF